jgi:gamma-glutamylcyclotransferase (GGCT)/AIG2-like uncharacterized protein YtfP
MKLFIYGTLKNAAVQKRVIGRVVIGVRDVVDNYIRKYQQIDNEKYPTVCFSHGSYVIGFVINLTKPELALVDNYESGFYKRIIVRTRSGKKVWIYVKNPV